MGEGSVNEHLPADAATADAALPVREVDILIIGAGFSGMIMAIEARGEGFEDILILEKADELGGTWRENTYPGVACDIPSHLYALASHPKVDWSRKYAPGAEIWDYMRAVARREGLDAVTRFGRRVTGAEWDGALGRWRVETAQRERYLARVLVSAMGPLHVPKLPRIPGLEGFRGAAFHSARWDHEAVLEGRRIGVVGTGASGVQIVPELARRAGRLTVYQRSPPWVVPRHDRAIPGWRRWLHGRLPGFRWLARQGQFAVQEMQHAVFRGSPVAVAMARWEAQRHMARAIRDPALRAKLTPGYEIGCKRVLFSDDWYPALARENVELVTEPIARIGEDSVVTADGEARPADVLVFATGFRVTETVAELPFRGRGGRTLAEAWKDGIAAYLGAAVHGFPNLFLMLGPNTGLGHNSVLLMVEAQARHVARLLAEMRRRRIEAVEPRPDVQAAYAAEMQRRLAGMVWQAGGCSSWYQDAQGRNPTLWPGTVGEFRRRARAGALDDYRRVG